MNKYILSLIFITQIHGIAFGDDIYKWTDKNGVVHFSDKPIVNSKENPTTDKDIIEPVKFKERLANKLPKSFCEVLLEKERKSFDENFNEMNSCIQVMSKIYDVCYDKSLHENLNIIRRSEIDKFSSKISSCSYDLYIKYALKKKNIYLQNEQVDVGYFSYKVIRSVWTESLSENPYLDKSPYGIYLKVEILIRNNDHRSREIPQFFLVSNDNKQYSISSNAIFLENAVHPYESINPELVKNATLIFDVPKKQNYYLKINDSTAPDESKLILLGEF